AGGSRSVERRSSCRERSWSYPPAPWCTPAAASHGRCRSGPRARGLRSGSSSDGERRHERRRPVRSDNSKDLVTAVARQPDQAEPVAIDDFSALYRRELPYVLRTLRRLGVPRSDVEDVLQE